MPTAKSQPGKKKKKKEFRGLKTIRRESEKFWEIDINPLTAWVGPGYLFPLKTFLCVWYIQAIVFFYNKFKTKHAWQLLDSRENVINLNITEVRWVETQGSLWGAHSRSSAWFSTENKSLDFGKESSTLWLSCILLGVGGATSQKEGKKKQGW